MCRFYIKSANVIFFSHEKRNLNILYSLKKLTYEIRSNCFNDVLLFWLLYFFCMPILNRVMNFKRSTLSQERTF